MQAHGRNQTLFEPRTGGVWSLASPQPEMPFVLAGTVARPTASLNMGPP